MAEKSFSSIEIDQAIPEKVNGNERVMNSESMPINGKSQLPVTSLSLTSPEMFEESSADESNPAEELHELREHQVALGRKSYASAAAAVDNNVILHVSMPDTSTGVGRPRPRTVFVKGATSPRVLIEKLRSHNIVPQQVQGLLSSELAVTFRMVADKQSFLNYDFVPSTAES